MLKLADKKENTLFFVKTMFRRTTIPKLVKKIRANLEHFEAGKCKDKKRKKNDEIYFFKTPYKRMT